MSRYPSSATSCFLFSGLLSFRLKIGKKDSLIIYGLLGNLGVGFRAWFKV